MNLALVGYGRMGHEIERIAISRGHTVGLIIDVDNIDDLNSLHLKGIDAVIEFTTPDAAFENISTCLKNSVPVVSGTTGWLDRYDEAADLCRSNDTAFIHSSNFSIGVNLLFRLNSELARLMKNYKDYSVSVEEIHHTKKLDAPSGTALKIVEGIINNHSGYKNWKPEEDASEGEIPVKAIREGMVPGTHTITWDSDIDSLTLKHEAKNRKGLAFGAVVAAEYISGRKGVFTMDNVMGF